MAARGDTRYAGVCVGESHVAEEVRARAGAVPAHLAQLQAHFEPVAAAEPADLVLELPDLVEKARPRPVDLRDSREPDAREVDFENAADIRQVRGEPLDAEIPDHLQSVQRSLEGIVVEGVAEAELVEQRGSESVGVDKCERLVAPELPPRAKCGEVSLPLRNLLLVDSVAPEELSFRAYLLVEAAHHVVGGVKRAFESRTIVAA